MIFIDQHLQLGLVEVVVVANIVELVLEPKKRTGMKICRSNRSPSFTRFKLCAHDLKHRKFITCTRLEVDVYFTNIV